MKRKIFCLLLSLVLLCSLLPIPAAFAAQTITSIEVSFPAPVAGASPSYTPTFPTNAPYYNSDYTSGGWTNNVMWVDEETQIPLTAGSSVFAEGKAYSVTVYLTPNDSYAFAENDADITATINGQPVKTIYRLGKQIGIKYVFPATKAVQTIKKIEVSFPAPVAGASPSYTPTFPTNAPYYNSDYTSGGWTNNVMWVDEETQIPLTAGSSVFAEGKAYSVTVYLTPNDGYAFAENDADITATINGQPAKTIYRLGKQIGIKYVFPAIESAQAISNVDLTVVKPVVGKTPTFAKVDTAQYFSEKYGTVSNCFNGVTWTNQTSGVNITVNNPFKADAKYTVTYYLIAKDGYEFTTSTACTINGIAAAIELTDQYHAKVSLSDLVPGDGHGHIASDWKSDAENHWKECTVVGCGVVIDGSKAAHTAGDWITDTPATVTTNGTKHKECTTCGYVMETGIIPATAPTPAECDGGENCPSGKFVDINAKAWYHLYVDYAVTNGLFGGTSANTFEPETAMTRAMLVTVLWRYEGQPKGYENAFTDVNAKNGSWYIDAVAWAASNGIVNGVGNNRFDPNGKITREQMAAILFRYAQKKGIDTSKRGELSNFPDANKISAYAKEAVCWAVGEGIINGSDGKLLPQGNATRAQVATILMRYIENIVKK